MGDDDLRGLFRRWLGLHALAFAVDSLVASCIYLVVIAQGRLWDYAPSVTAAAVDWSVRAFLVATAQSAAILGTRFPARPLAWGGATFAGIVLGALASRLTMSAVIRLVGLKGPLAGVDSSTAGYVMWGAMATAAGGVLALAQAVVLFRRVSRERLLLWTGLVLAGWIAPQAINVIVARLELGDGIPDLRITLWVALKAMGEAAVSGLVFAAIPLPALRRLLAPRP